MTKPSDTPMRKRLAWDHGEDYAMRLAAARKRERDRAVLLEALRKIGAGVRGEDMMHPSEVLDIVLAAIKQVEGDK